jgi:integrase/recombinase XerD
MDNQEALTRFEQFLRRRAPGRRTAVDYVSDVRLFYHHCSKPWPEVSMTDIDAFVDHMWRRGLKPATIKRRVTALRVFFDFLAEETGDLEWPNPVHLKRHGGKVGKHLPRDLSDAEVDRLWAVIQHPRDRALVALMLRAGLRVSEVIHLRLEDIAPPPAWGAPARLRVQGKGQKERTAYLCADAYALLQSWLAVRPPVAEPSVFLNARGHPLSTSGVEWLLKGYGQQAGVAVTPHRLRHTFARQLVEAGMSLPSLSRLLGHEQLSTTQLYVDGADPALRRAYQEAMEQLQQRQRESLSPTPPPPASSPSLEPEEAQPPERPPQLPNWEAWAPDLPTEIRQACLKWVQSRVPTWKASQRHRHALRSLGFLARFWRWVLAHRPMQCVAHLTPADVQAYLDAHLAAGQSANTMNCALDNLLGMLHYQVEQGEAISPALFRLRRPARPDPLPRYLEEAQMQQLEAYARTLLRSQGTPKAVLEAACFFILAHSGLRPSELAEVQCGDVDLEGQRLVVREGKGMQDRVVYLSDTATLALRQYLSLQPRPAGGRLLVQPSGRPLNPQWLWKHIRSLGEAAGVVGVSPYRLRHTFATRLLNVGLDVTRIQKLLGHKYLSVTMVYARLLDSTLEQDYRQAMAEIERQHMPLSDSATVVANWPLRTSVVPVPLAVEETVFDNSV